MEGWSGGKVVNEGQSLIANEQHPAEMDRDRDRRRLHLVGGKMMFLDTVGVSHHRVVLIEAPHAVHFIVDAAGDVLNVLHMGPVRITHTELHKEPIQV